MGTGLDGDSGWGKVWRAAAWAQLGDRDTFYAELKVRTLAPYQFSVFPDENLACIGEELRQ